MEVEPVSDFDGLYLVKNVYDPVILDNFLEEDIDAYPSKNLIINGPTFKRKGYYDFPEHSLWKKLLKSADYTNILKLEYICKPNGACLYIDEPNFSMPYHIDKDIVIAAMQVYLKPNEISAGTTFEKNGKTFTVPYIKNCGYFNLNKKHQLKHAVLNGINEKRYSIFTLFIEWKKFK